MGKGKRDDFGENKASRKCPCFVIRVIIPGSPTWKNPNTSRDSPGFPGSWIIPVVRDPIPFHPISQDSFHRVFIPSRPLISPNGTENRLLHMARICIYILLHCAAQGIGRWRTIESVAPCSPGVRVVHQNPVTACSRARSFDPSPGFRESVTILKLEYFFT